MYPKQQEKKQMRYTEIERAGLAKAAYKAKEKGVPLKTSACQYGVHSNTLYCWNQKYNVKRPQDTLQAKLERFEYLRKRCSVLRDQIIKEMDIPVVRA